MWKDVPDDRVGDLDFIIDLLDWERNIDPNFVTNRFMAPYETALVTRVGRPRRSSAGSSTSASRPAPRSSACDLAPR